MQRLLFIPIIFLLLSCEDKQESIDNNVPVANDISIVTNEDVAVSIEYSDNDDATLVYEVVDAPTNGSVSNGIYTPDTNFNGEDSLTYRAYDGDLYSETASVTITVHAVNDAPEFSDIGNQQVDEGETLEFTISATRSLIVSGEHPGGPERHFCNPAVTASRHHLSTSIGIPPKVAVAST